MLWRGSRRGELVAPQIVVVRCSARGHVYVPETCPWRPNACRNLHLSACIPHTPSFSFPFHSDPGASGANSGVEGIPRARRVPSAAVQSHYRGGAATHRGEEAAGERRVHRLQLLQDRRPQLLRDVRGAGVARHQGHTFSGTDRDGQSVNGLLLLLLMLHGDAIRLSTGCPVAVEIGGMRVIHCTITRRVYITYGVHRHRQSGRR